MDTHVTLCEERARHEQWLVRQIEKADRWARICTILDEYMSKDLAVEATNAILARIGY